METEVNMHERQKKTKHGGTKRENGLKETRNSELEIQVTKIGKTRKLNHEQNLDQRG